MIVWNRRCQALYKLHAHAQSITNILQCYYYDIFYNATLNVIHSAIKGHLVAGLRCTGTSKTWANAGVVLL